MEFSIETVRKMMEEAFEQGYAGCSDMRDDYLNDIIEKYKSQVVASPAKEYEFRVWATKELKQLPKGIKFQHQTLGDCEIAEKHGKTYMTFANAGLTPAGFNVDGYPWDGQMKRMG